jgi:hypothetical protein
MEALLLLLIGWLNLHTEYDTRVVVPNIAIVEQGNLCLNYGIVSSGICQATRLKGFYNERQTIFLYPHFDPADPADQSRLLHELVHYLQWHNGEHTRKCWGVLEAEAYRLQDEWRAQNGINHQTDPFKLVMLEAACDN